MKASQHSTVGERYGTLNGKAENMHKTERKQGCIVGDGMRGRNAYRRKSGTYFLLPLPFSASWDCGSLGAASSEGDGEADLESFFGRAAGMRRAGVMIKNMNMNMDKNMNI